MNTLRGASVVVTGGAGAFGQAFVRHALAEGARRVVVFSRDEAKQAAMRAALADERVRYFLGDVRDAARVRWAVRGADVVVHAAAIKRVDSAEMDPTEAIATNIDGTRHVAEAVIRERVARAVFLSTDKAAAPSTLYGLTKATAERLWIQANTFAAGTGSRLSATRYGNVLASTGSVLPIWKRQAAEGAITLTDPTATRFWMTMADAVALVDLALACMEGGETFVPRLRGAAVAVLADSLYRGLPRATIGLQNGEKRHETLIAADEAERTIDCGTHYVIRPSLRTWAGSDPAGVPVGADFVLRSDTAPQWDGDDLRRMAA